LFARAAKVATRWQERLEGLTALLTSIIVGIMAFVTFISVCMRAAGTNGIGDVELLAALMGIMACLPMAAAQAEGHIGMTIFSDMFKGRAAYALKLFIYILTFIIAVLLAYSAVKFQVRSVAVRETTAGLYTYPLWIFRLSCPIGLILFITRVIQQTGRLLSMGPSSFKPKEEVPIESKGIAVR
jgi:TRAP-type C4-dicarboxylate transport system permease small subunit